MKSESTEKWKYTKKWKWKWIIKQFEDEYMHILVVFVLTLALAVDKIQRETRKMKFHEIARMQIGKERSRDGERREQLVE